MRLTPAILKRLAPSAAAARLKAICDTAPTVLPKYGITTRLRMTHFFAQLAHESGDFNIGREKTNYRAQNLAKIWDSGNWHGYFSSRASLMAMAGRGEELLNIVYGNRMGNGPPSSGDGYRYRGGGLAQITGKDGYAKMQKITGFPLVKHPEQVFDPDKMLEVAAAFWKWKNLEPLADQDNMIAIAMRWNGARKPSSIIGLKDRKTKLALARKIFTEDLDTEPASFFDEPEAEDEADYRPIPEMAAEPDEVEVVPSEPLPGFLSDGKVDPAIVGDPDIYSVQKRLKAMNFAPGKVDGKWGGMTAGAIVGFINDRGLDILAPTNVGMFREILPELKAELHRAEVEHFKRPVSAIRKRGDVTEVAQTAPEVVPVRRNFLATMWLGITTFFVSIWDFTSGLVMQAWNWFSDNKDDLPDPDSGIISTATGFLGHIPAGVWLLLIAAGLGFIAYNSWRGVKKITESVQTGQRQ